MPRPLGVAVPDYPAFDWLRLVLASLIFWEHAHVFAVQNVGNFVVQIFFVLSGWLIGGILLKMEPSDLPRFFYNRATRIWIPYAAAVALLYLTAFAKEGIVPHFFHNLAFDLTLTHNLFVAKTAAVFPDLPLDGTGAHFWSIAVEEQFYLLAPLLLVLTPIRRSLVAWGLLTVFAILFSVWYGSVAMGVFAVMLQRRHGDWHLRPVAIAAMLGGAAMLAGLTYGGMVEYGHAAPLMATVVILLLARPGRRTAIGGWAGGISYPMYLNHWTGLFAANMIARMVPQAGGLPSLLIGFAFAIVVAAIAYRIIDRTVMEMRGRLYTPALGRGAMIWAYGLMMVGLLLGTVLLGPIDGPPGAPV